MKEARHVRTARPARLRWIGAALVALALMVGSAALAGCASEVRPGAGPMPSAAQSTAVPDLTTFPVTITDDAFREVTFTVPPQRIVSLAPANTEIVYALQSLSKVVGVTTYDDYPTEVANIAKMGDFTTPNLEAIAAAQPDLILITGGVQADVLAKLENTGAKVVVIDPKNITGVMKSITTVSQILGVPKEGAKVVGAMQTELTRIRAAVSGEAPVRTFLEIGWNPLYTAGPGTLLDDVLTQAGGVNVVTQKGYVGYSVEQLVKDQPTVYLGTKSSIGTGTALADRPGYDALTAIQQKQFYGLDDNLVSRPGPRIIQGVLEVAKLLHPDLFK
jgi:iron complex transport system substrate-binding protein